LLNRKSADSPQTGKVRASDAIFRAQELIPSVLPMRKKNGDFRISVEVSSKNSLRWICLIQAPKCRLEASRRSPEHQLQFCKWLPLPNGSNNKGKTKMNKKSKNTSKAKKAGSANQGGGTEAPLGHWNQWIEPRGAALLSEIPQRCYFIIKNHGPASVKLVAQHGDLMDLAAGSVRATYAYGMIRVENPSAERVLIECDFVPIAAIK
jgi:hypothetical protein